MAEMLSVRIPGQTSVAVWMLLKNSLKSDLQFLIFFFNCLNSIYNFYLSLVFLDNSPPYCVWPVGLKQILI